MVLSCKFAAYFQNTFSQEHLFFLSGRESSYMWNERNPSKMRHCKIRLPAKRLNFQKYHKKRKKNMLIRPTSSFRFPGGQMFYTQAVGKFFFMQFRQFLDIWFFIQNFYTVSKEATSKGLLQKYLLSKSRQSLYKILVKNGIYNPRVTKPSYAVWRHKLNY